MIKQNRTHLRELGLARLYVLDVQVVHLEQLAAHDVFGARVPRLFQNASDFQLNLRSRRKICGERTERVLALHLLARWLKLERSLFAIFLDDGLILADVLARLRVRRLAIDTLFNRSRQRRIHRLSLRNLIQPLHRIAIERVFAERRHDVLQRQLLLALAKTKRHRHRILPPDLRDHRSIPRIQRHSFTRPDEFIQHALAFFVVVVFARNQRLDVLLFDLARRFRPRPRRRLRLRPHRLLRLVIAIHQLI